MIDLYYATTDGSLDHRASPGYKDKADAQKDVNIRNGKAKEMGIKTRYSLESTHISKIDPKEHR
jgi:hypothetical protein